MADIRVLIAAAGAGTRAGLPYPKTLHPVGGRPILVRQLELLRHIDSRPAVVVSPTGYDPVAACLRDYGLTADLLVQEAPTGMGDAVLCASNSPQGEAEHLLLLWGDIPFLDPATIEQLRLFHLRGNNHLSFATRHVEQAYTMVVRDKFGRVVDLQETRELGLEPVPGERDIGLFIFKPDPVLDLLRQRLEGASGRRTGEHGFLYIIRHLAARRLRVGAATVAQEQDLISLNSLSDIDEEALRALVGATDSA